MTQPKAVVTASSAAAAKAGAAILRQGGNAVDAAVATALASCVADPCNTGLGGYGGHMVVAPRGSDPVCIDFNMWVPEPISPALSSRAYPNTGPGATAVPNVVAGLAMAVARLGTMTWADVSEPARALAQDGVSANSTTTRAFAEVEGAPFISECFSFEADPDGTGFSFRQPALAKTLESMQRHGPQWFYEGPIGDRACELFERARSHVDRRQWAEALAAATLAPAADIELGPAKLYSAPLGTSGSASMFATVAAGRQLGEGIRLETPEIVLDWAQALARLWSYRFGSPRGNDFRTTTAAAWVERALRSDVTRALPDGVGHTCHLNTCDTDGTLVAVTLTHGPFWFGARWAVPESGVIMNAGMHLLPAAAPVARHGRSYAVTNMAPAIACLRDGSAIAVGCPGARRIPTMVGLVLARHLFGGLSLQQAVSAGRFHAESRSKVTIERERWNAAAYDALKTGFEQVGDEDPALYYGPLTAIRREPDGRVSVGLDDRIWQGFAEMA